MNPLKALQDYGQSVWLDFLERGFIADGRLARLVEEDGLKGVTSNPAIFEKAIAHGDEYQDALRAFVERQDAPVAAIYEHLAIEDIRDAADVLRPVYEATDGRDGYVSLEVSPYLALATDDTVEEARRLWRAVGRPNLMVKVPATPQGLPAIRRLIGDGVNVNITLLFSQEVYEQVADAYIGGLEDLVARGGDPRRAASVASFFVSRIDSAIDALIEERLHGSNDAETRATLESLKGKVAIANAKLAYRRYKRLFSGARWEALRAKGARTQRLLWASTGTKNEAYSDVLYVDELIGPDTVNTLPPATMDAFRDHGKPRASLEEGIEDAGRIMATLARVGISIDDVTAKLVDDGVRLFVEAADRLLAAVARQRARLLGGRLDGMAWSLPAPIEGGTKAALEAWRKDGNVRRLWAHDANLWTGADEASWLGWLRIVDEETDRIDRLQAVAEEVRREGFTHALLLGMGGSSLGPEVLADTFGRQLDRPELLVLDSTDPAQIRACERRIDPSRTLFIVSSKSGSTLEPNILKQYFFERAKAAVGAEQAGSRFVAITDPGSSLQAVAERDGFRHVFFGLPSIGGRYSVLSNFGLVPAAAMGLDVGRLLDATRLMVRSCAADVPPSENPGVRLGAVLAVAAQAGRDKVTVIASEGIASFGAWLEQLLAESTGKRDRGLVPVDREPLGRPEDYGPDRLFVHLRLEGDPDPDDAARLGALEAAGHPVLRITLRDRHQLGQEFFRWEIATAVAGAILGINPFDQPDVEASKAKTRELTDAYETSGVLPPETPILEDRGVKVFADERNAKALAGQRTLAGAMRAHLGRLAAGDYFALLAYIERNAAHTDVLQETRLAVRDAKRVATCLGFGPRFLHSTGQAYKGGPNTGVFVQITADPARDLGVPGRNYSFGIVEAAQARGDFDVLAERGRRALRLHLGPDVDAGLKIVRDAVRHAVA